MATSSSSNSTATVSYCSGRLGSASPSTSVVCQEVFDETSQPSLEEIKEYAILIGIDPVKEPHLIYLAKEGLMQALPPDWKICYSEEKCGHYYYNTKSKVSQWDHPLDSEYRALVEKARKKHAMTPGVDNSDDASQLDSGIRSLQGTDYDGDNTNNTNEMTSPIGAGYSMPATAAAGFNSKFLIGGGGNQITNAAGKSGFSGGVSRFLETRSKQLGPSFQSVKNSRFEVSRTSPQIGLALTKFGQDSAAAKDKQLASKTNDTVDGRQTSGAGSSVSPANQSNAGGERRAFILSGTGTMFLKSRKQSENSVGATSGNGSNNGSNSFSPEAAVSTPPGVKSILRDSSLTDIRRRSEKDTKRESPSANGNVSQLSSEDKKSVRFNLEEMKMRSSPEEDGSSSKRLTQSPEVSVNSDDDPEDYDPWDDDDNENDVMKAESSERYVVDGNCRGSLNPFLVNDEKHVKGIKVIPVPKSQTIQMLKAQSLSMDLSERDRTRFNEKARSQSMEADASNLTAVGYLDKLKDAGSVKPLYEDTDSESKASSVRSFIVNKSEEHQSFTPADNNPFDLEELGRMHSHDVEQLEKKLHASQAAASGAGVGAGAGAGAGAASEKLGGGLRTLKVASKLVNFLKKDSEKSEHSNSAIKGGESQSSHDNEKEFENMLQKLQKEKQSVLKEERERLEELLQHEIDAIKQEHEIKLKSIRHEYDLRLASHQHQMEEAMELQIEEYRSQLEEDLDAKRRSIVDEHKAHMATLQQNHSEILHELERDLKSEEEILRKENAAKMARVRDKLEHELEMERQRMRESGEEHMYEKVRCEKRLLEDKYRCLKEKYIRLKTDVKLSLERRNRRREAQALQHQSMHATTGSETERSISNKPSIGNSENRSLSLSTSCQERGAGSNVSSSTATIPAMVGGKPPVPPKTHLVGSAREQNQQQQHVRERSAERGQSHASLSRRSGVASKYLKHLQANDDTTSISQSDTTISNNYPNRRYLAAPVLSDNGNSDSEALQYNQENNNNSANTTAAVSCSGNGQRKKLFSRTKSASTSRLNSENFKGDRPCTPVESLRHQLQKLEDLEDQFPENALDTTYHLRYPFSDISNDRAGNGASSELEFFKHRIHLERDSVRRAKESLRVQRTNFRARQREIKLLHKATVTRHSLDQLILEEKELTEMEVNLHRTRALLGEKVIRLRHLEQSLLRIYEKDNKQPNEVLGMEHKDDATLSDVSSHSSSGFSSTDFASGCFAEAQNLNKRKETYHQKSAECIQNLEILNAEIREILEVLGKSQQVQQHNGVNIPIISPSEINWQQMLPSAGSSVSATTSSIGADASGQQPLTAASTSSFSLMQHHHAPQSIPTLADRLETYRQLASGRMQSSLLAANTIVSQSPRAVNYTTSLVERTRDLRNWLRQAKNEHDMLSSMSAAAQHHQAQHVLAGGNVAGMGLGLGSVFTSVAGGTNSGSSLNGSGGVVGGASHTQANL